MPREVTPVTPAQVRDNSTERRHSGASKTRKHRPAPFLMKTWIILALTALVCLQVEAQEINQWQNIASLPPGPGSKWRIVTIPQGTLALNILPGTPAAAFRPAGTESFSAVPLPPLQSSWTWPAEISEAVTGPDGVAYISCSSGIWQFTPTNGGGWEPTFLWSWDTSDQIVTIPNLYNITLVTNAPPPPYLLAVYIRSFGAKSGYRLIHPGLNPNLVTVDARLDVAVRQLKYQGNTLAWAGYSEIHPDSGAPAVMFLHSTALSRDGGQTSEPLSQGYFLEGKGGAASWLLRDAHQAAYRFDGQQITPLNFGSARVLSETGGETYLSSSNGTFRRISASPQTYAELTGGGNPLAIIDGRPAAIRWADTGLSLDKDYVSFQLPSVLPTDIEWFVEETGDLVNWSTTARSTGVTATEWENSGSHLYFATLASGRMSLQFLRPNYYSQRFFRIGVRLR